MSVINDRTDELSMEFNELESKVLILLENMNRMEKRLKLLEQLARDAGVKVSENGTVEGVPDQCSIN